MGESGAEKLYREDNPVTVPPSVLTHLDRQIPQIVAELVDGVAADVPEYADYLVRESDEVLDIAREALRLLVGLADPTSAPAAAAEVIPHETFEELGREEYRAGRTLRGLLAAYRTGARVAWRHVAAASMAEGVSPAGLAALAEAVFAFVDELSDASARGYADEQSAASAARERQLLVLSELLLSGDADPATIEAAAVQVGWRRPAAIAIVLAADGEAVGRDLAQRLGPSALPVRRPGLRAALVGYPADRGARLRLSAQLRGCGAVVGLPGVPAELPSRFASAEAALALAARGLLPADDPLFVEDHLATLIVHRDPALLGALATARLAPLRELPAGTRARLRETLLAWLDHHGDRRAVAEQLNVHPQTVRYRMEQLHRLFGPALVDPAARLDLALALRLPEETIAVVPRQPPVASTRAVSAIRRARRRAGGPASTS